jgi:hypothetical protein
MRMTFTLLILLAWLKALTARQGKTVGARLAGESNVEDASPANLAST